jgi:hypothetical protein
MERADLAVCNLSGNAVDVLIGNGDGTFQSARSYPAGSSPYYLSIADVNGDRLADLIVSDTASPVAFRFSWGKGTDSSRRRKPTPCPPVRLSRQPRT